MELMVVVDIEAVLVKHVDLIAEQMLMVNFHDMVEIVHYIQHIDFDRMVVPVDVRGNENLLGLL
jgi:hypothetical protein